ncbi:MAG: hypothetical protein V1647_05335, partial [Pseudomonadota bacterium]
YGEYAEAFKNFRKLIQANYVDVDRVTTFVVEAGFLEYLTEYYSDLPPINDLPLSNMSEYISKIIDRTYDLLESVTDERKVKQLDRLKTNYQSVCKNKENSCATSINITDFGHDYLEYIQKVYSSVKENQLYLGLIEYLGIKEPGVVIYELEKMAANKMLLERELKQELSGVALDLLIDKGMFLDFDKRFKNETSESGNVDKGVLALISLLSDAIKDSGANLLKIRKAFYEPEKHKVYEINEQVKMDDAMRSNNEIYQDGAYTKRMSDVEVFKPDVAARFDVTFYDHDFMLWLIRRSPQDANRSLNILSKVVLYMPADVWGSDDYADVNTWFYQKKQEAAESMGKDNPVIRYLVSKGLNADAEFIKEYYNKYKDVIATCIVYDVLNLSSVEIKSALIALDIFIRKDLGALTEMSADMFNSIQRILSDRMYITKLSAASLLVLSNPANDKFNVSELRNIFEKNMLSHIRYYSKSAVFLSMFPDGTDINFLIKTATRMSKGQVEVQLDEFYSKFSHDGDINVLFSTADKEGLLEAMLRVGLANKTVFLINNLSALDLNAEQQRQLSKIAADERVSMFIQSEDFVLKGKVPSFDKQGELNDTGVKFWAEQGIEWLGNEIEKHSNIENPEEKEKQLTSDMFLVSALSIPANRNKIQEVMVVAYGMQASFPFFTLLSYAGKIERSLEDIRRAREGIDLSDRAKRDIIFRARESGKVKGW